jgi:hypothetical protein
MNLHEVLKKHGYEFRQHIEEEGWGWRKPTVIDLDMIQLDAMKWGGVPGLQKAIDEQRYRPAWGLFTYPALDITEPLPRRPDLLLVSSGKASASVVAPKKNPELWAMAQECVDTIKIRYGVHVPLLDESDAKPELLETEHLIIFGGSHQNRLALELALRYRTFFVDASVPGDDGWVVTTHCGIHASGNNIVQLAASPEHRETALKLLFDGLNTSGDDLILKHIHRICPGKVMSEHFPSWEKFADGLPKGLVQLQGQSFEAPKDIKALSELLAKGLDSGGKEKNMYNVAPVDIAITCARYYQVSGEPRALELFRELLFRMVDYFLKTPGGASYLSDLDFRLGMLILHYGRLEHEEIFNDEDRLLLSNFLLSCTRSIHEYTMKMWPMKPGNHKRHNHPTFKALSLLYAASYFSRFNLPYIKDWLAYTESVFKCRLWKRSKQGENSRLYEPFVFDHAASYAFFTGHGLELFDKGCYEKMTERQIAATDNFFRAVDYGDTGIYMNQVDSMSAGFLATNNDGLFRWFAGEGFARNPIYVKNSIENFPGLRMGQSATPSKTGDWELMPMDRTFLKETDPGFPGKFAFDKLAFRTGWGDEDQYLLLEGVGGKAGHSHNETNGIVRLNHLGRHWIVSNGYGRRVGITNASKSFSSKENGPADHNMLVLERAGEIARELPMGALLQHGRKGLLLYSTSSLIGYGGVNWFRTLIILSGKYVLAIDRIQVVQAGLEKAHVEWNCLGKASVQKNGFRLDQKDVFMDVTTASGWNAEQTIAEQSACWKSALDGGSYPYASFPLAKLVFHMPELGAGQTNCLGTLLAATRSPETQYMISQPEPGRIIVEGPHELNMGLKIKNKDLSVRINRKQCEVCFNSIPEIPAKLTEWKR